MTLAQLPNVLPTQETQQPPPKLKPERSTGEWKQDVTERLAGTKAEIEALKQEEADPPQSVTRQYEALTRIELLLTQLVSEKSKEEKLDVEQEKLQSELDELIQDGLEGDPSFRRLDEVREELRSQRRRFKRSEDKAEAAVTALDTAEKEFRQRSSQRRQAQERSDDNNDDQKRQSLGEKLAAALRTSEVAEAVVALRKQESINAKSALEIEKLQTRLLEETENRLAVVVTFSPAELDELFQEIDRQEDDLKKRLARFESAAEPRIRYVEEQWINAQRQLDAATEGKQDLQERVNAFELEYQALRNIPSLLRMQIDRLAEDRKIWRARQWVFVERPDGTTVLKWAENSKDTLSQLEREQRKEDFEIDELEEQLDAVEDRLKEAVENSVAAVELRKQTGNLRGLLRYHEDGLRSIKSSIWLHERLLDELRGDTLATTARDQLQAVWNGISSAWNYELTKFGEGANERSVTVQKVVTALLIFCAGFIFSRALSRALGKQVLRRLDIDPSASATIQSLFYYVLLLTFSLVALNIAKVPLTAFTVLGGAVALGIGFGSQNIINNFISGLILLAERPVKVGDLIQLDQVNGESLYGNIEHIGARSTRVRTGSNLEIIVPNSSFLQNNVVNFTLSSDKVRTKVEVGVIYGSPTVTVTQLLRRAVIETGRVAKDPPPIILFKSFGDDSLVFEVHFWLRMRTMMDQMQIESAVRFRIDQLFREEGIVIAFPQRDVHLDTTSPLAIQVIESDQKTAR